MPKTTKKRSAAKLATKASAALPSKPPLGYMAFTKSVFRMLRDSPSLFVRAAIILSMAFFITTGFTQIAAYSELTGAIRGAGSQIASGLPSIVVEIGVLFLSIISGSLLSAQSEGQQLYVGAIYLLAWLVVIWLLRHVLSKNVVTLRDGLYNAAAPIVSTLCIAVVAVLQLLPLAIIAAIVSALSTSGVIDGWLVIGGYIVLLAAAALTLYWLVTTLFAAVIVTIPGTYPVVAIRSARQLVRGYRGMVLKRLLWGGLILLVSYTVLVLPVMVLDAVLDYPFGFLVVAWSVAVNVLVFIYGVSYLYVLYREVIDGRTD